MPWIVKLDKEQDVHRQVGARALRRGTARDGARRLPRRRRRGADGGRRRDAPRRDSPIGQVTSARHSPQLGGVIGMAWVPATLAKDGARVTISDEGKRLEAQRGHAAVLRPGRRGAALVSFAFLTRVRPRRRALADGARGARSGRTHRAARRVERGGRPSTPRRRAGGVPRDRRLRGSLHARQDRDPGERAGDGRGRGRRLPRRAARARAGRPSRTARGGAPYTPERALVLCEPAATADLRGRLEEAAGAVGGRPACVTSRPRMPAP